jgi:hypothetical protein
MIWKVHHVGDTYDLSQLTMSLTGPDINLACEGDEYLLTSDRFNELDDVGAVFKEAQLKVGRNP